MIVIEQMGAGLRDIMIGADNRVESRPASVPRIDIVSVQGDSEQESDRLSDGEASGAKVTNSGSYPPDLNRYGLWFSCTDHGSSISRRPTVPQLTP
jgi:hypothetical protein